MGRHSKAKAKRNSEGTCTKHRYRGHNYLHYQDHGYVCPDIDGAIIYPTTDSMWDAIDTFINQTSRATVYRVSRTALLKVLPPAPVGEGDSDEARV